MHNSYCCGIAEYIAFFIYIAFYAFGDLLFVNREDAIERLKKSREKRPLSNAEGLAQRKSFL